MQGATNHADAVQQAQRGLECAPSLPFGLSDAVRRTRNPHASPFISASDGTFAALTCHPHFVKARQKNYLQLTLLQVVTLISFGTTSC